MPRNPRRYPDSGWHHIFNRGARRQDVFFDNTDRSRFLAILAEATKRHFLECHAHCLMGNHYHLLVLAEGRSVSNAMHWITSRYVREFNKRHGFDGPLFRARFGSTPIEDDEHLIETLRYVHNNPVDLGEPTDRYEWSSHRNYLGRVPTPRWLSTDHLLQTYFGGNIAAYQSFVDQTPYHPLDRGA